MRIAVVTCWKYRDCWEPFAALFDHFWPNPNATLEFITDSPGSSKSSWCDVLNDYITKVQEPILLMQEDFFLSAPVRTELVHRAIEQYEAQKAGCVRLYPCPGGIQDYGDPHYAIVPRGTQYRISCQAALWRPSYLKQILSACGSTPFDFEIRGTELAEMLDEPVLAFKRELQPWPMEYLCSAISRGKWNPDAKVLCDRLGISADWSQREFVV